MSSSSEGKKKKKSRLRGLFSRKSSEEKKAAKQEALQAQRIERTQTLGETGMLSVAQLQAQARREQLEKQNIEVTESTHQDPVQDFKNIHKKVLQKFQKDFVKKYMMSGEAYGSFVEYDEDTDYSKRSIQPNKEFVALSNEASIREHKIPSEDEVPKLLDKLFSPKERDALKHNQKEMKEKLRNPDYVPKIIELGQTQQMQGDIAPPLPSGPGSDQRDTSPSPSDGGYDSAGDTDPYAQVGGAVDSAGAYAPVGDGSGTSPYDGEYAEVRSFDTNPLKFSKDKEVKILPLEQHMQKFNIAFYDDTPIGKVLYQTPLSVKEKIERFHKDYIKIGGIVGDLKEGSFTIDHAYQVYSDYLFSERFSGDFKDKKSYIDRMKESSNPSVELGVIAEEAGIPEDKIEILRKSFNNSPSTPLEYRVFDKETSRNGEELLKSPEFKAAIEQESTQLYNQHSSQWKRLMQLNEEGCQKYAKARALESKVIKEKFKIEKGISDYLKLKFDDKEPKILGKTQSLGNAAPQLPPKRSASAPDTGKKILEVDTYQIVQGQNPQAGRSASAPPTVDDTSGRPVTGVKDSFYADIAHGKTPADLQRSASAPARGAGSIDGATDQAPPRPPKAPDQAPPIPGKSEKIRKEAKTLAAAQGSISTTVVGDGSGDDGPPVPPKSSQVQSSASAPARGAGSGDDGPPLPNKQTPPRPPQATDQAPPRPEKPQDPKIENPLGTVTKAMLDAGRSQEAAQRSASAPAAGAGSGGGAAGPKTPPRPPKSSQIQRSSSAPPAGAGSGDDGTPPQLPKKQRELDKANIGNAIEDAKKIGHGYQNLEQLQREVAAIQDQLNQPTPPTLPQRTKQPINPRTVILQGRKGSGPEFNA